MDLDYEKAIMYSIGFNGYIDCIEGLQLNIKERKINYATFIDKKDKGKNYKKIKIPRMNY
jgi:hypothetical protein